MLQLTFDVRRVQVIRSRSGPDTILIHTTLPGAGYPFTEPLVLKITAERGGGVAYVREHFNTEPEIIR